ncbi:hypothetical protein K504DRAFT_461842 [Pleomassaria siparia CBS 279.74]|uniref:SNF2 family helicase/ATPase-like protein n=1 Tax=Pleomassaria siparia CBS 279.74 TaxID=1314801 RepID=A0A6G1KKC7_9PLEO|nr:hypothetical protein K504DRAFT_461842 [Pleomassaria siparia CBS 279.74]
MDPAALLDPKGPRKRGDSAAQPQTHGYQPQFGQYTYDPRTLLHPRSMSKRPAVEPQPSAEQDGGQDDPTIAGQVSLVERLHNVHDRAHSPAKRIKTEDERKKSRQLHMGGGSTLAPDSTNHTPAPSPPTASNGGAIDLTMSDDEEDEVFVVQDNSKQMICIGRMKKAYAQATFVPYPDPTKYRGNAGQQSRIKVRFRRAGSQRATSIITVVDPTGCEFGRIDSKTALALAPLMDAAKESGLDWMAWTEPRRKQPNEGGPGTPLQTLIALTLQLYCPRKSANNIGRFCKIRGIDLADPILDLQHYDYFNPQTLHSFNTKEVVNPTFQPAPQYGGGSYVLRSVDEIRNDVQHIFDSIVNQANLPIREQTPMIKTKLMKHQKQALQFMWEREFDWSNDDAKDKDVLYQAKVRDNGRKYYVHVITGEEFNEKPASTRGGILADEMGLGKTLSILSLVADQDSLDTARMFAQTPPPAKSHGMIAPTLNSRATILLCPLSTMVNWKQQLDEHFPKGAGLKWCHYHGPERKRAKPERLANYDLVITTYQIVAADINDRSKALPYINWFRIVLDEAHAIRSPSAKQSIGACTLPGQRRWAVTGTPVQNKLEDLGALFKFLRVQSFDTTTNFNHYILSPFKNADPDVVPKLQLLVSSVTLRRVKQGLIELPHRTDQVVRLQFSPDERKLHDWFELDSARKVNAVTSGEKLGGHSYARILTAILNLRLICAHGRDLLSDEALKTTDGMTYENPVELEDEEIETPALTGAQAYDMLELLEQTSSDTCIYCSRNILDVDDEDDDEEGNNDDSRKSRANDIMGYMTSCYHIICLKHYKQLTSQWQQLPMQDGHINCHFCESRVRPVTFALRRRGWEEYQDDRERIRKDPKLAKKIGRYIGPHTKTKALLEELRKNKAESDAKPMEPPIKSVIFSTWTTHLDLIEIALKNHGYTYCRLDGRMTRDARTKALESFAADPSVHNILVSIGAGGLGLNLTTANKVYVMEPQFNPAAEAQAVDRVHRLGQKREVTILRFIMDGSFEEKMLDLQRKKRALADLTMAREKGSKEQMAKQRLEDLRSLFK